MSISTNVNAISRRTTAEDAREMEELLPPILRAYGAIDAKDGDSIDVLDGVHFMGLVCSRVYSVVGLLVNFYNFNLQGFIMSCFRLILHRRVSLAIT